MTYKHTSSKFVFFFIKHYCIYPTRFCRASLRPYESGKVNLVTIPSGPNTFDGILSNESDNERESELSCILKVFFFVFVFDLVYIFICIKRGKEKNI